MRKSCTRTAVGWPVGRHVRPAFLKSPTNSFFFVSTEITGWPAAWNWRTCAVMWRNWGSPSGFGGASRVFRIGCTRVPTPPQRFTGILGAVGWRRLLWGGTREALALLGQPADRAAGPI